MRLCCYFVHDYHVLYVLWFGITSIGILWPLEFLLFFLAKSKSALAGAALRIRGKVYPIPEQTSISARFFENVL